MNEARRCTATSKQRRDRCRRAAIRGGSVCAIHGGKAPQVRRKAAERLADLIDPNRAIREAVRLSYSDIRELFDEVGQIKPVKDWPDHIAAAVAGVEVTKRNLTAGDGAQEDVVKLKLWDKPKNLELLFRHLGLLKDRLEITGDWDKLAARLAEARKRENNE